MKFSFMRTLIIIVISFCVSVSCKKPESTPSNNSTRITESSDAKTVQNEARSRDILENTSNVSDSIPAMNQLGRGSLSARGSAEVFKRIAGRELPHDVVPLKGRFWVWQYSGNKEFNGALHESVFQASPETAARLVSEIKETWKHKYPLEKDFVIRSFTREEDSNEDGLIFKAGTEIFSVFNPYLYYQDINLLVMIDPKSGGIKMEINPCIDEFHLVKDERDDE